VVDLHNDLCLPQQLCSDPELKRASLHVGELLFDPQGSYGAAIGLNLDSTVAPGKMRTYRYFADQELGTTIAFNLASPVDAGKGAFAAVIVEPKDSEYRVLADIVSPTQKFQKFREIVTLFHDSDPFLGQNAMPYPWEAHCKPEGNTDLPPCIRTEKDYIGTEQEGSPPPFPPSTFTSVSYKLNPWRLRKEQEAPADVYNSRLHGDPGLVAAGAPGSPLRFRVAAPWAEQIHVFSLSGHRWRLEPAMNNPEQLFAHMLAPGYAFDVSVIGGFGGDDGKRGDLLFYDARMPFTQAGLWGFIRVESKEAP
jgi:manganese oxidase